MTPAEHLAEAERLLGVASNTGDPEFISGALGYLLESIGHALIAAAAELGVPHTDTTTGGTGVTPQPAAS